MNEVLGVGGSLTLSTVNKTIFCCKQRGQLKLSLSLFCCRKHICKIPPTGEHRPLPGHWLEQKCCIGAGCKTMGGSAVNFQIVWMWIWQKSSSQFKCGLCIWTQRNWEINIFWANQQPLILKRNAEQKHPQSSLLSVHWVDVMIKVYFSWLQNFKQLRIRMRLDYK